MLQLMNLVDLNTLIELRLVLFKCHSGVNTTNREYKTANVIMQTEVQNGGASFFYAPLHVSER